MATACIHCKGPVVGRSSAQAIACRDCMYIKRPRIAEPARVRMGSLKPLRLGNGFACLDCLSALKPNIYGGQLRRPPLRCDPCRTARYRAHAAIQGAASSAVAKAIREGVLKRASECICVDCGAPAVHYDHRDYTKPLQVEPVCRSCNVMRGPADVWPELGAKKAA